MSQPTAQQQQPSDIDAQQPYRDQHEVTERPPPSNTFDLDDSQTLSPSLSRSSNPLTPMDQAGVVSGGGLLGGVARHTLGLMLLLLVVFLWTVSNFLGSSIFADNSYAKPFFLTYLNTSCFTLCILPTFVRASFRRLRQGTLRKFLGEEVFSKQTLKDLWKRKGISKSSMQEEDEEQEAFLKPDAEVGTGAGVTVTAKQAGTAGAGAGEEHLSLRATARLSLAFCILWFTANYLAMACLQYTTVASTTILTSTSSVWTLLFGAITGTEKFTWRKLCGVLASLVGIVLISQVDLNSDDTQTPGPESAAVQRTRRALDEFPDKTPYELALGDALALLSALIYGFYTITLKKTTVSALPKSIHMPTFFGLVGVFNTVLLLPLFPILHLTGFEPFALPPSTRIWMILLINSVSSLLSDICWAYAMVFTSPLVVTVGLSLTIPLSLIGEMIVQARFESWVYWVGAMIVVGSFVFVEREEKHEEDVGFKGGVAVVDEGEPGPAIVVQDYDDDHIHPSSHVALISRSDSPDLLAGEGQLTQTHREEEAAGR